MIRITCTADNRLGRYYGKLSFRQLAERRVCLCDAFARMVDFAISKRARLIVLILF